MGKLIVAVLAAFTVMVFAYMLIGGRLGGTAVHISSLGWNVSYGLIAGGVVFFGIWRIVKGK